MAITEDGKPVKLEDRSNNSAATKAATTSKRQNKPRRSLASWLFNTIARISLWYALVTVIFRCPSSTVELTESSPQICQPYLTARDFALPHIQPYYDTYARSYVETAKPYTDQLNTKVLQPAYVTVTRNYEKYAAPQLNKAKEYGYSQWDKAVLPHVQLAQQQAYMLYASNLAPHVNKVSEVTTPYYETARDNALDVHQKHIIPALNYSRPHLESALLNTQRFILDTGLPFVQHSWSNLIIFVDGTLWPFLRTIYRDNVKPQLVMISERIAKYQESRKMQSALDELDTPSEKASYDEASTTIATATESVILTDTPTTSVISMESVSTEASAATTPSPSTQSSTIATDETIDEDLSKWQRKFSVAAERGTEDLRGRMVDIINGLAKSSVGEGEGLSNALEKTAEVELDRIRSTIKAVVKTLPEEVASADTETAEEEVLRAIREAGQKVKGRAKNVRAWTEQFKKELQERTALAADSTLQVLDGVRDLGLQEIGIRWANMEGITYKHWEKYHGLKKTFEDWRTGVKDVALKHPSLEEAHESAQKILEESMAVTEETAKELARLKDVAKWKIRARDDTDDFESRVLPAAAVSAASSLSDEVQDAVSGVFGESQGTVDSLSSQASSNIVDAMSSASSLVSGTTGTAESVLSEVSSSADEAMSSASSVIIGSSTGTAESILSEASSSADEALSDASSFVLGSSTGSLEALSSSLDSAASAATDAATDYLSDLKSFGTIGPSDEGILSSASDFVQQVSSSVSSVATDATKPSYSKSASSVVSAASGKASEAAASLNVGEF